MKWLVFNILSPNLAETHLVSKFPYQHQTSRLDEEKMDEKIDEVIVRSGRT